MSKIKLCSAALLAAALPTALLFAGCSGESQPAKSAPASEAQAPDKPVEVAPAPATEPVTTPKASVEPRTDVPAQAPPETLPATPPIAEKPALPAGSGEGRVHSAATAGLGSEVDAVAGDDHDHDHDGGELAQLKVLGNNEGARLTYEVGFEKHVFGHVMQGTVAEHVFRLKSTGTEDLIIKQVKPTCGCTVAQVFTGPDDENVELYTFGDAIPPGNAVHFPAKLHTKNKSGHQNTRINIFSNDPRGTIQLGLEADIDPFFTIAPHFLNFGQISVGDVVSRKARISAARAQPIKLQMVEQTIPAGAVFDLQPVNPDEAGRAAIWELSVTLGPDLVEGNLARALQLVSDVEIPGAEQMHDGTVPTYVAQLTLSAQVVGPFSYNPPYLSMGLVRPGQVVTRTVTLESHDPEFSFAEHMPRIRVAGLQNPGTSDFREWEHAELFTPVIRPVDGKNAVDVEVRLEGMPENATGSFRGTLLIDLDHQDKPQIALVITGVCRGGPVK